jgi:PPOX class probable F420-dependent enzyme
VRTCFIEVEAQIPSSRLVMSSLGRRNFGVVRRLSKRRSRCYAVGGSRHFTLPNPNEEAMAAIPEKYSDLLAPSKKSFAHLATLMEDGSPQVTPVWLDYTDGMIRVNTARGRVKDRNLKVGSRVALSIQDPENPYRYVQIRGKVAKETEQGADAHIDSLAKKYMGVDSYPFRNAAEKRVIYFIEPTSGQGMN